MWSDTKKSLNREEYQKGKTLSKNLVPQKI